MKRKETNRSKYHFEQLLSHGSVAWPKELIETTFKSMNILVYSKASVQCITLSPPCMKISYFAQIIRTSLISDLLPAWYDGEEYLYGLDRVVL